MTHSIGNCIKRVVVIVASVIAFQNPVSAQNAFGARRARACATARGSVLAPACARACTPAWVRVRPHARQQKNSMTLRAHQHARAHRGGERRGASVGRATADGRLPPTARRGRHRSDARRLVRSLHRICKAPCPHPLLAHPTTGTGLALFGVFLYSQVKRRYKGKAG